MRRRPVFKRFQHMSEKTLHPLPVVAQQAENLLLHISIMYADAAARQLISVADDVVALRADFAWVRLQHRDVFVSRSSEGMVRRLPALLFLVPLEQWEVHNKRHS